MNNNIIIAPSVLSLDYSDFDNQLNELKKSNANWIHFDVMDGHFVPNLTFGPTILKGIKKKTNMFIDVHLMVEKPIDFVDMFVDAGADLITFHIETIQEKNNINELIDYIHTKHIKVGISVKPNTSLEVVYDFLNKIDVLLIMSVEPGFGGQRFIENSLKKIKKISDIRRKNGEDFLIQVDGGINEVTGKQCIAAGCDVLVAGSFIFNGDIIEQIDKLLCQK